MGEQETEVAFLTHTSEGWRLATRHPPTLYNLPYSMLRDFGWYILSLLQNAFIVQSCWLGENPGTAVMAVFELIGHVMKIRLRSMFRNNDEGCKDWQDGRTNTPD